MATRGDGDDPRLADPSRLHPDLEGVRFFTVPFHHRRLLPLWRLALRFSKATVVAGVDVSEQRVDGVRATIYRPRERASGAALLWLHGGGFIVGQPSMDDARCSRFARELGLVVVSVDYRLAPEHPFPAALDDAATLWSWLARAEDVDPTRVAIGGESAGGGLAACLAQRLRDEGGRRPAAQLLVYPMLDDRTAARTDLDAVNHRVWHNRSNRTGWSAYLGRAPGAAELPDHAVAARCDHLHDLPPTWIGVGGLDLFRNEVHAYARRLETCGVPVTLHEVPGAPHGFVVFAPDVPITQAFVDAQYDFLRERLARPV
jgi:acetyl esterase/lipase